MMMNYEQILEDYRLPRSVRYAKLRSEIVAKAKNRAERRQLLMAVGQSLEGTLVSGTPHYWIFKDRTKAKFQ